MLSTTLTMAVNKKPLPDNASTPGGAKRSTNNLVALGSAAVVAVYGAGFMRTQAAASRFADEPATGRHPVRAAAPTEEAVASLTAALDVDTALAKAVTAWAKQSGRVQHAKLSKASPAHPPAATAAVPHARVARANPPKHQEPSAPPGAAASEPRVVAQAPVTQTPVAPDPVAPPKEATPAAKEAAAPQEQHGWRDGVYTGYGTSRHGDIEASVEIRGGRIVDAKITQCLTRYSCSWIDNLPRQVIDRQSADVDYVSGATQSSNAFYYAIAEALNKAKSA